MNPRTLVVGIGSATFLFFVGRIYLFFSLQKNAVPRDEGVQNPTQHTIPVTKKAEDEPLPLPSQVPETTDSLPSKSQSTGTILVLVPPFFDLTARQDTTAAIAKTAWVETKFQYFPSRQSYYAALTIYQKNPSKIDMLLAPTHVLDSFEDRGTRLQFPTSVGGFFHPLFTDLLNDEQSTFIPYAIDAPVTLHAPELLLTNISYGSLLASLSVMTNPEILSFTIGLDESLIQTMLSWEEPFAGFSSLFTLLLRQAGSEGRTDPLTLLTKAWTWDTVAIQQALTQEQQITPPCKEVPSLCLVENDRAYAGFAFLSELEYRALNKQTVTKPLTNFPVMTKGYPVTGRWRIINKKSTSKADIARWMQGYLTLVAENALPQQTRLLPASNEAFQQQKILSTYEWFHPFQYDLIIRKGSLFNMSELREQTSLAAYLTDGYSVRVFLKELADLFGE